MAFWHRVHGDSMRTWSTQGQHKPMMSGWHKKGEHYRKVHNFFNFCHTAEKQSVLLESIGLKANRDQLGTT